MKVYAFGDKANAGKSASEILQGVSTDLKSTLQSLSVKVNNTFK